MKPFTDEQKRLQEAYIDALVAMVNAYNALTAAGVGPTTEFEMLWEGGHARRTLLKDIQFVHDTEAARLKPGSSE